MRSLQRTGLVVLVACGLAYVVATKWRDLGLDRISLPGRPASSELDPPADGATIRIASFNIQAFGQTKLAKPQVMETLVNLVRRFDIVAIQEIRSKQQDVMPRFVELINKDGGRQYDFVISRRLGRTSSQEQYAFVFDAQRVEVDRRYCYTVADPGDRLHREPFVAAFRARGPPPDQAFTFTLINIHTDPDEVDQELNALDDVYRAVQYDGRGEDDVILLGDLNTHSGRSLSDVCHHGAEDQHPPRQAVRQHPLPQRGDQRVHRSQRRRQLQGGGGVDAPAGARGLGSSADLGRVQQLRRRQAGLRRRPDDAAPLGRGSLGGIAKLLGLARS
jgi:endonuclease/exonuclease/phosphatase family metal-dependent hydrolase